MEAYRSDKSYAKGKVRRNSDCCLWPNRRHWSEFIRPASSAIHFTTLGRHQSTTCTNPVKLILQAEHSPGLRRSTCRRQNSQPASQPASAYICNVHVPGMRSSGHQAINNNISIEVQSSPTQTHAQPPRQTKIFFGSSVSEDSSARLLGGYADRFCTLDSILPQVWWFICRVACVMQAQPQPRFILAIPRFELA